MTAMHEPLGTGFRPQPAAVSPWNPDHQSGIAIAALLTHLIEQTLTPMPMMVARLTIDIVRPAPMQVLQAACTIVRDGKRMQNLDATLAANGLVVARASGLKIRLEESPSMLPDGTYPLPEETTPRALRKRDAQASALETRVLRGGLDEHGPGATWACPRVELLPGIPVSPVAAAAMAADVGSGVSNILDRGTWLFPNVDLSLHFIRPPVDQWVLVDAQTFSAGAGSALVNTTLADRQGIFGHAHQTLFVSRFGG